MKFVLSVLVFTLFISCSKDSSPESPVAQSSGGTESQQEQVSKKVQQIAEQNKKLQERIEELERNSGGRSEDTEALREELKAAKAQLEKMINSLNQKLEADSLAVLNQRNLKQALEGHTSLYKLTGRYNVMVIPVQFADVKFKKPEFYEADDKGKVPAQDYLFGEHKNSLTSYYSHASFGQFKVGGEVTPIITVDKPLANYGKALGGGTNDINARGLVVEALEKLKALKSDQSWWSRYDTWDLSDYDKDHNFHEPDGFIDAVVLVYAGKSQSSCQADFDPDRTRPGTDDVSEDDPRRAAKIECFNRIWPHRHSIYLSSDDPRYSQEGPMVEGKRRSSLGGLKIHDNLFASDYNMQSEYSDLSTFMHEFGHSLSLPDVYSKGKSNSTGSWELMSSNAPNYAQELSSFSKLSLGWLTPKVIREGEETSAYLGAYNFVSESQRQQGFEFLGPISVEDYVKGQKKDVSIVSLIPEFEEPVYRSLVVLMNPNKEKLKASETELPESFGEFAAYSGRDDQSLKKIELSFSVPEEGKTTLKFDTLYHIETETNFLSTGKEHLEVKVLTDYDLGVVKINGEVKEELRLVSGDNNFDTLNESLSSCDVQKTLELRKSYVLGEMTKEQVELFKKHVNDCQKPSVITKSYDVSSLKGQTVELSIEYKTDPAYTEFGIIVDNVRLEKEDKKLLGHVSFEEEGLRVGLLGDFKTLQNGEYEVTHNQFYLMEYRTPGESYKLEDNELSYNMDNNIKVAHQSMFLNGTSSPLERFRLVTYDYQPGVLVWYFNSKYDRRSNDASSQEGQGYLLVLNSKVQELKLPDVLGNKELFNEKGNYATESDAFKTFQKAQRDLFACFSYPDFYRATEGNELDCTEPDFNNTLKTLSMNDKKLIYRREGINEVLPVKRYEYVTVGKPLRIGAAMRTGLSTFRPKGSRAFAPFKIYKEKDSKMTLDEERTAEAPTIEPVSSFSDADNEFPSEKNFQGDTVVVNKRGLSFNVVSPSQKVLELYSKGSAADDNDHFFRRPRAKVYFQWRK